MEKIKELFEEILVRLKETEDLEIKNNELETRYKTELLNVDNLKKEIIKYEKLLKERDSVLKDINNKNKILEETIVKYKDHINKQEAKLNNCFNLISKKNLDIEYLEKDLNKFKGTYTYKNGKGLSLSDREIEQIITMWQNGSNYNQIKLNLGLGSDRTVKDVLTLNFKNPDNNVRVQKVMQSMGIRQEQLRKI